jgi:hypothetical protein
MFHNGPKLRRKRVQFYSIFDSKMFSCKNVEKNKPIS